MRGLLAPFLPPLGTEFPPPQGAIPSELVSLGQMLYFDPRLSKNQDLSCNTCHLLDKFGVDGAKVSTGHKGQKGGRNAPTVYNAAGHFVQFWDGRSPSIEHQATQPVQNPVEMAMPGEKAVAEVLESIPGYQAAFAKAFPQSRPAATLTNAGIAIGAFERKLATPGRWDKFLKGDGGALTQPEQDGFQKFVTTGCPTCHGGTLLGGNSYQKLGAVEPWPNQADTGRMSVTKAETDKMMFKVPSLRNIAETAPYFHDSSASTLEEAVTLMAKHQLGKVVTNEEVASIVTFLKALTGEIPEALTKKPELPASSPTTPKPNPQ